MENLAEKDNPQSIQIAAAILQDEQGRVLLGRRPQRPQDSCAGLWEFPGGKIEAGESQSQCLERECWEELNVQVRLVRLYDTVHHIYPEHRVQVYFWLGKIETGEAKALEHDELRWVGQRDLADYAFCPANAAIVQRLAAEASQNEVTKTAQQLQ